MNVAPGATFEWLINGFATGIGTAGTAALGVRIRDGAGADFLARTTTGITEDVTVGTNAVYRRSFTAPTTAGQYWLIADDGSTTVTEELVVTYSAASVSTDNLYFTRAQLKAALNITSSAQDDEVDLAVSAASRAIDNHKKTRFYPTTETRYYSPSRGDYEVVIDDLNTLTSLQVDPTGDGTYDETWTVGTEFVLEPVNAPLEGKPYRTIQIRGLSGKCFPGYPQSVKVSGSFGWAETPPEVQQAAAILSARLYERRNAPFGILAVGVEATAAMRLSRTDPDVASLLDEMDNRPPILFL